MLCPEGVLWETDMPWPADPSRPADIFIWGDMLDEVRLGVYAVDAVEAATDCGEVLRCASIAACDMMLGT